MLRHSLLRVHTSGCELPCVHSHALDILYIDIVCRYYIGNVTVAPEARRRGIARILLQRSELLGTKLFIACACVGLSAEVLWVGGFEHVVSS